MSTNLETRFYQPGDEYEIVELLKISFPYWASLRSPVDYLKWRYLDSYYRSFVVVVTSGKKIICINLQTTQKIKMMGTIFLSTFGAETATHPDFRGMGAWNKTLDFFEKSRLDNQIKFHYSNTQNPIVIQKSLNTERYTFPHQMNEMLRMKNAGQIKSLTQRSGFIALKALNKINNSFAADQYEEADFEIIGITHFDDGVDKFFAQTETYYNYCLEKNHQFLNWRYFDPRGGDYHVSQAMKDGEVLGFIVLESIKAENRLVGNITDLLTLPGREDVAKALIRDACEYFDDREFNSIKFGVAKGHPYQSISSRLGFLDTSMVTKMLTFGVFSPLGDIYERLSSSPPDKICYNLGDVYLH